MTPFDFQGTTVRTIEIDGELLFHATDVCKCVGLGLTKGSYMHLRKVAPDEKRLITPNQIGGLRGTGAVFVTEAGLYRLIMRADSAKSEPFRSWVVKDVLPAIRRTGAELIEPS